MSQKVYSNALGGQFFYYSDRSRKQGYRRGGKAPLQLKALIIKYNQDRQHSRLRAPDLLTVMTGGELANTKKDGVKIIPIGCVKD